ncbi:MAG: SpoIIE family protein phosphatase [Gammaproteobacteria bacterium]|nr:SpoIIE family protein phosphatase [Gammaproteobacteria bacterium]
MDQIIEEPQLSRIDDKIANLRRTHFLQYASDTLLTRLAEAVETRNVPAGSRIVEKGEQGDTMFFLVEGEVRVHDGNVDIARLDKGAMFGEIAALSPQQRTASITANKDSVLYSVHQDSLYAAIKDQPDAARSIIQGLCNHEAQFVSEAVSRAVKVKLLQHELDIGRRIQRGFLPAEKLNVDGWEIEAHFQAAREVAGDFYDYFKITSVDKFGVVVGDVCDKGVGAALFMTLFRSLLRSSALSFDVVGPDASNKPSDEEILVYSVQLVNHYVATTHGRDSMFASMFFALIDPQKGEFTYINAGHEAPIVRRTNGACERLETTGPVVGLFEQAKYATAKGTLAKGDMLIGFSDGLTEARNNQSELFGEDRVFDIVHQSGTDSKVMVSELISALNGFVGSSNQYDDITILAVGRRQNG